VSLTVHVELNGVPVPVTLDDTALAAIAAAVRPAPPPPASPWMTIPEAAAYMRCSRQRVDDLLSQRRLTRHRDGRRVLVSRAEIEAYVGGVRA
jgi:excisionase family DNA binding protein